MQNSTVIIQRAGHQIIQRLEPIKHTVRWHSNRDCGTVTIAPEVVATTEAQKIMFWLWLEGLITLNWTHTDPDRRIVVWQPCRYYVLRCRPSVRLHLTHVTSRFRDTIHATPLLAELVLPQPEYDLDGMTLLLPIELATDQPDDRDVRIVGEVRDALFTAILQGRMLCYTSMLMYTQNPTYCPIRDLYTGERATKLAFWETQNNTTQSAEQVFSAKFLTRFIYRILSTSLNRKREVHLDDLGMILTPHTVISPEGVKS